MAVLGDRETHSRWDHISGEAFDGPLAGGRLDVWPVRMTTVGAALIETPGIEVYFSTFFSWVAWISRHVYARFIKSRVWFPPPFHLSMSRSIDPRLPRQTQGLGVIAGKHARYYPVKFIPKDGIEDDWRGRCLQINLDPLDGVPYARWKDTGEPPMQLLTRWYGFSFTYPDCKIWMG